MSDESNRTVWVALLTGVAVTLSKVGTAIITSSPAMAAEASHSIADNGNDLFLLVAQRRSARPRDERHPFGYGREAYFWALLAALGAFIVGAAFSLREGITELLHPSSTSSFGVAYVVLALSTVFDLLSLRQSVPGRHRARRYRARRVKSVRREWMLGCPRSCAMRGRLIPVSGLALELLARDDIRSP